MTWRSRSGSAEGINEKPSVPKSLEGLRKLLCKLYKLFSSFLRGASRPKSPRDAAITAVLFMEQAVTVVKGKVGGARCRRPPLQANCCFPRPIKRTNFTP